MVRVLLWRSIVTLFWCFENLHFSSSCTAVHFDVQIVHTTTAGQRAQIASIVFLHFYEQGMVTLFGWRDGYL